MCAFIGVYGILRCPKVSHSGTLWRKKPIKRAFTRDKMGQFGTKMGQFGVISGIFEALFPAKTSKMGRFLTKKHHFGTKMACLCRAYLPQPQSLPQPDLGENDLRFRQRANAPYAAVAAMIANTMIACADIVLTLFSQTRAACRPDTSETPRCTQNPSYK